MMIFRYLLFCNAAVSNDMANIVESVADSFTKTLVMEARAAKTHELAGSKTHVRAWHPSFCFVASLLFLPCLPRKPSR